MYFNLGDILVSNENNKVVYLVLEVSPRGNYFAIILSHINPIWIGKINILDWHSAKHVTNLKDMYLNVL